MNYMNSANTDVQGIFIGMLQVYPKLFDAVIIEPKYMLDINYRALFIAMNKSMEDYSALVTEKMFQTQGFNADLYIKCADTVASSSPTYFKQMQDVIIGDYKRSEIKQLSDRLYADEISINDFNEECLKINIIGMAQASRITHEILINSCISVEEQIEFIKFRKLGIALSLEKHDFMILAAGTGVGKTGAAINLALDLCKKYKILYFNMEMTESKMYRRMLSVFTNFSQKKISNYVKLSQEDKDRLNAAAHWISEQDIVMSHDNQSLQNIRACLAMNDTSEHMIVILDHVGLIKTGARNSYERATEIAITLRQMSKEYNCTIIGLSQLNREGSKNKDKMGPELHMLRDSGEMEQSARKVLFLWEEKNNHEFVIVKNDSGPKGRVKISYDKTTQAIFESASQR